MAIVETSDEPGVNITGGDRPERVRALRVNAEYFDALSVRPVRGRAFERHEETADSQAAVVTEDIADRYLGGVGSATGVSVTLDGVIYTVIGFVADGVRDPIVGDGLYGVLAHSVERRRHEIGVRMALGASRSDVRAMIMRHGMSLALAGVLIGLAGAFVLSRALRFLVFGVSATDPVVFVAVPLLLLAVALVATWLPARHATRMEPASSLGAT